jgi:ATP-dependent metalloprotease FtsH
MFSALFKHLKKLSKNKTFQRSVLGFAALFAVATVFITLTAEHVIVPPPQAILPAEFTTVPTNTMDKVALEQSLRVHNPDVKGLIFFNGLDDIVVLGPGLEHDQMVTDADVAEMRKLAIADNLPISTRNSAVLNSVTDQASGWWWTALVGQVIFLGYLLFAGREEGQVPCRFAVGYSACTGSIERFLQARKISSIKAMTYLVAGLAVVNVGAFSLGLYQNKNVYQLPAELSSGKPIQPWQISRYLETNPGQFQRVTFVDKMGTAYVVLSDTAQVAAVPGVPGTVPHNVASTSVDATSQALMRLVPAAVAVSPASAAPLQHDTVVPVTLIAPAPLTLSARRATFPATAEGRADYAAFVAAVQAHKIESKDAPAVHNTNPFETMTPIGICVAFVLLTLTLTFVLVIRNKRREQDFPAQDYKPTMFDQRSSNAGGPTGSGGSAVVTREEDKKTFADVAGCQEAIDELLVVKKKIMRPRLYKIFGAPVPSGVILFGPPGTGKTLLARALAGEVGGSFQAMSGSEFVEMYVGVGAKRVREAYAKARADARRTNRISIVFIDEFDALAKKRGNSSEGGNREYEQTLNQLLVEMNGFGNHGLVLTMAATNRLDILDEAVLRPGRFDIKVKVPKPDRKGRALIYGIYLKKLKLVLEGETEEAKKASMDKLLDELARRSHDFSGAEIEGAIKDGATIAVERQFGEVLEDITTEQEEEYRSKAIITEQDLHLGIDKMAYGTQIRSRVRTDKERWATAVHEIGHASVPTAMNGDPVNRITIVMTDKSLGLMDSSPEEGERYDWTREQFMVRLQMMLAGRAAEKVILNKISTGASNDFERASALARQMVGVYGMSEEFGNKSIPLDQHGFPVSNIGETMLQKFNDTWGSMIDTMQAATEAHIEKHRDQIERCARALYDEETLTGEEFRRIWAGDSELPPQAEAAPASKIEGEANDKQ